MADDQCNSYKECMVKFDSICRKLESESRAVDLKLEKIYSVIEALKENIKVSKLEFDARLELTNQWKSQFNHQASEFITRKEVGLMLDKLETHMDLTIDPIRDKVVKLDECRFESQGSKRWSDHIITVLIAALIYVVLHFGLKI